MKRPVKLSHLCQILLSFWLYSADLKGQTSFSGFVKDSTDNKGLVALIQCSELNSAIFSDSTGFFEFKDIPESFRLLNLEFRALGYNKYSASFPVSASYKKIIFLHSENTRLDTFTVNRLKPGTLYFGSNNKSIVDFLFIREGLLIATYDVYKKESGVVLLSKSGNVLFDQPVDYSIHALYTSCNGRYYAISQNSVFELRATGAVVSSIQINASYFYNTIQYYVGYHKPYYYFTGFSLDNMTQAFFIEDTETHILSKVPFTCAVRYKETELVHNSIKQENLKRKAGWKAFSELGKGNFQNSEDAYYSDNQSAFFEASHREIRFQPVFSPFFVGDSSVLLVNYPEKLVERYDFDGSFIDTTGIETAPEGFTVFETLKDMSSGKIVVLTNNKSDSLTLFELVTVTGKLVRLKSIVKGDKKAFRLRNGYLYFLSEGGTKTRTGLHRIKIYE